MALARVTAMGQESVVDRLQLYLAGPGCVFVFRFSRLKRRLGCWVVGWRL